ncbi:MAG TPA: helix-turn-helix domain-containing protein [Candidatus Limnocylindrales bacterium]|jgi:cytoskeletal protein RodZ
MTTRDQARRHAAEVRSDAASRGLPLSNPVASLPERLLTARERKGVDLFRAERDTKIRARYLAALERGDYRELPGAVYTKGFLRNYALYLGLDPDEILLQWRRERGEGTATDPVLVVPRTVTAPRQGITISPKVFGGLLLALVVVVVVGYVATQLVRFSKPPTVTMLDPSTAVVTVDETATTYTLRGTTSAGATVSITIPGRDQPIQVTAGADGSWSSDVELRRGRNQFSVTATDPDTGKQSDTPYALVINVPISAIVTPSLTIEQPADGAKVENGAILVQGSAPNATQVTVTAAYTGATTPSGTRPQPTPPVPPAQTGTVGSDGAFSVPFNLTAGRWTLTVSAAGSDGKATSLTRSVTVNYQGVNLVVSIRGGSAWLLVWEDGIIDKKIGAGGKTEKNGTVLTFTATNTIEVRTGKSSITFFTLNGQSLGSLGAAANPETWLFDPPAPPKKTNHT